MNINGEEKPCLAMTFEEFGEMLIEASPNKDGIGLTVSLTHPEHLNLMRIWSRVGYAIFLLMANALEKKGLKPAFTWTYNESKRVFSTTAKEAQ